MTYEHSAGAVVFTKIEEEIRYVIIRSQRGDYGFPKGHLEGNETAKEAALREIREETGLSVTLLDGFVTEDKYRLPRRRDVSKTVTYFVATYEDQPLRIQEEEVSEAALMTFDEAYRVLRFPGAKRILTEADAFVRAYLARTEGEKK